MNDNENILVEAHRPCEDCGSSDARALYSDGHEFCFSCQTRFEGRGDYPVMSKQVTTNVSPITTTQGFITDIPERKISLNTCKNIMLEQLKMVKVI